MKVSYALFLLYDQKNNGRMTHLHYGRWQWARTWVERWRSGSKKKSQESAREYNTPVKLLQSWLLRVVTSLPLGQEAKFPPLFDLFDSQKAAWGLQTYSLSMSTLEEVFLRLAEHEKDATALGNSASALLAGVASGGGGEGGTHAEVVSTDAAPDLSVVVGEEGGDVWAELESFECHKSAARQVPLYVFVLFQSVIDILFHINCISFQKSDIYIEERGSPGTAASSLTFFSKSRIPSWPGLSFHCFFGNYYDTYDR